MNFNASTVLECWQRRSHTYRIQPGVIPLEERSGIQRKLHGDRTTVADCLQVDSWKHAPFPRQGTNPFNVRRSGEEIAGKAFQTVCLPVVFPKKKVTP